MKTFRAFAIPLLAAAMCGTAYANGTNAPEPYLNPTPQDNSTPLTDEVLRLDVDMRGDYNHVSRDSHTYDPSTGFEGRYLMLRVDGMIMPGLTYSWRQRINKNPADFNGTDWIYLNYAYKGWNFQAGKQVVGIGGYEYDRAPMDLYGCSIFWNNIPCFKFGAAVGYNITGSDRLTMQVTESPFVTSGNHNMYGYNLSWNGSHGFFESIWSANMMEYTPGKYINYLALGNKFTFDKVRLEFDFMNRAASHQTFLFKDCSVMTELSYAPNSHWRIYGKHTYDVNHSGTGADLVVLDGTEMNMAGGGLEFFPLANRRHRLRLHAGVFYYWGKNANTENTFQNKTLFVTTGLTWDINLLNLKHK